MDFEDFLREQLQGAKGGGPKDHKSQGDSKANLEKFLNETNDRDYGEGDYVERNKYGRIRYKFPKDNQVAKVLKIDRSRMVSDDKDEAGDTLLIVMMGEDVPRKMWVDGAYYMKSGNRDNVVKTIFGKR